MNEIYVIKFTDFRKLFWYDFLNFLLVMNEISCLGSFTCAACFVTSEDPVAF